MTARFGLVLGLCLAVTAGCGDGGEGGTTVSGKVTVAGAPLTGGTIMFQPVTGGGGEANGMIMADGKYAVKGVAPGEYKVTVDTDSLRSAASQVKLPGGATPPPSSAQLNGLTYVKIDPKYSKAATSGLATTVGTKSHTYDIDLK